jgi:hypothetical protein
MVDYEIDGPTYQAVADQIMDDVPDIPEPHLRIQVDYDGGENLFYTIESHGENRERYHDEWGSYRITESIDFSDGDFDYVHDFLSATLEDSTGEIPLMYNGEVIRENLGDLRAFNVEDKSYPAEEESTPAT